MSKELRKHFEELISLTDEEFNYILSYFNEKKLKKHQFLVQVGDQVINDHFVVKGLLKSYYTNDEGKEHILQFASENWWVTDFHAYFHKITSRLNVDCLEDCTVLSISLENRNKICSEIQKIEHFFRVKANFGYVALQRRILSLLDKDAKERYEQFKELYPTLIHRMPKSIIASYLGVSRETLSRIY